MNQDEIRKLERAIDEITEIAQGFGLDFYQMRYEICPADIIYTFSASTKQALTMICGTSIQKQLLKQVPKLKLKLRSSNDSP